MLIIPVELIQGDHAITVSDFISYIMCYRSMNMIFPLSV